jgi:hypothetical protein
MMLMLWFWGDAEFGLVLIGLAWIARHYRRNPTVRRLNRLVAQDRAR